MVPARDADIAFMRYRPLNVRIRRAVLGCLALVAVLATISDGVAGHAAATAWLVALVVAGGAFVAVVRHGNAPFLYAGGLQSRLDPRYLAAVALIASLALMRALLPASWTVTFWAILAGVLFGFAVSPPSRPASD